jgi:hypothetical protein
VLYVRPDVGNESAYERMSIHQTRNKQHLHRFVGIFDVSLTPVRGCGCQAASIHAVASKLTLHMVRRGKVADMHPGVVKPEGAISRNVCWKSRRGRRAASSGISHDLLPMH